MTPHCYNRLAFKQGFWAKDGGKLRWIAFRMTAECMAWAAPEGSQSGPEADGWKCIGCKHDRDPRKHEFRYGSGVWLRLREGVDMTIDTKALRPVAHIEAREILSRFNNSHFQNRNNGEMARYSIPADPSWDDDLRLSQYIKQNESAADRLAALEADIKRLRARQAPLNATVNKLRRENERLQGELQLAYETLAVYANDEDAYLSGTGEPYGSIPTEAGIVARQARALASGGDK